jgi:hypothetical protein
LQIHYTAFCEVAGYLHPDTQLMAHQAPIATTTFLRKAMNNIRTPAKITLDA